MRRLAILGRTGTAMRYVIGICLLTAFIIWDGWANEGHYLDVAARQTIWLLRAIGVGH